MSQPSKRRPAPPVFLIPYLLLLLGASLSPAGAAELGSATLQIAGTRLSVSPLGQTVPFDTPTLVETHLQGYDAGLGALPSDLRVLGDFSGPGIEGAVALSTVPNEPFRIPRLRVKGAYALSNIRLVQDGQILGYAEPRSVSVNATQILITKVSARPLTQDEINSYGIVLDSGNYQTLNLTFGFAVNGRTFDYNMPVVYRLYDTDGEWGLPLNEIRLPSLSGGTVDNPRFKPPQMLPFKLELDPGELAEQIPDGGCPLEAGECRVLDPPGPPMVGVILFPTELTLLHQFFSVVLTVQNGAPEGDPLVIRDLTAKASFPSGLRPARTEPPTPLGVPVPLRVPGPDGEVGTADDVTFLIAQASAEAEFLVEGLREGTHLVEFDIAGILEGLPRGPKPISGKAKGAVVVRDPTLSVTITHPDVVRAQEEYPLFLTVTNLGKAPVNALDVGFKTTGLAGTQVVGESTREVGNLLPGDSQTVEFEMKALVTGRVVSSSARAGGSTRPGFELSVGVANGVPLSPESLVLPNTSKYVPHELFKEALGLIGLGWSLAKAPPSVAGNNPQATEAEMNDRVYRLSQMGRQIALGEELFEAASALAAEWLGARDGGWEWDGLRRKTTRGREMARALGELLAEEIDGNAGVASGSEAIDIVERLASTSHYLSPIVLGAYGSGLELEIASRTSGKTVRGRGAGMTRDLPFAELYPLAAAAELAMVARAEEGGYRAKLRRASGAGNVSFELVLPAASPTSEPTRYVWPNFVLDAGEVATIEFDAEGAAPALSIDEDGDGDADREALPSISPLARRPFEVVKAVLDFDVDLSAHVVEVLFSADVDLKSMTPRDPNRFRIEGRVSNGGLTPREESISAGILGGPDIENPLEGLFNPRIVRVVFNNPMNPAAETVMTVADLLDSAGRELGEQEVEIVTGPGAQPGTAVVGTVIDPYGQPLPYAEVSLFENDVSGVEGLTAECVRHRSARTSADAEGRFRFDYVRQTMCGNAFELEAIDPAAPHGGKARGEVRYTNQEMTLNVVMLGRAKVRGKVTYGDGTVPPGLKVLAYNPVFDEGRQAKVMPNGEYQMAEVVVGTVTLYAYDELGNRVFQTIEVPAAGAEVVRDLVMLKQSAGSAATLQGRVTRLADGEPSSGAHVVLTIDGQELGVRVTDGEGAFDFGTVPTGGAELVVYHPTTGRAGARLALSLAADQNAFVELHLRDERGRFVGYVKRQESDGSVTPVADAVVWAEGLPFNTRTDANGYYELPDVLTGEWRVSAADLAIQKKVTVNGTAVEGEDVRLDFYFRDTTETPGTIAGTVYGVDGLPVRNATIHLAGDEWSVRWHHEALTDAQGRFRIENVGPGIYGVHALRGSDGAIGYANVRFPGDLADIGIHFVRSRITGRTFTRDDEGNVFGVISLIRYRPVEVVSEWALVAVAKDYKTLTTNSDGTFAIDALPGPFELIVHNSFHGTQRRAYHLGAVPVDAQIEFQRSGSVHGVVVDHDGETPVPGVELRLSGGTFSNYILHSDENGAFDFELLPPGSYGIMAIDQRGGILREGFASVLVRSFGDKVDMKLALPKQGMVYGQVFDADWNPLSNVAVTLRGDRYPRQVMTQNTDAEGRFVFSNVYAGKVALVGKAPELGGLGGKIQLELGMEGEEVLAEIQLEGVGELTGRIINPDQGTAVPNAEVRIEAIGIGPHASYSYIINTDFEGIYRFERLPLTSYRIFAFDPSSGRHGVSAWVPLEEHGQVVELDLELEARGTVEGHLYNDPSQVTVPGATIQLESWGMVHFEVFSSTDIDGHFEFGGIPEGDFRLATTVGGRRARNEGRIETEDEVVTRDLHLEALARIEGAVRLPQTAAGPGAALADDVNVVVKQGSRVVAAASENPFVIEGLLPGHYTVEAREIDGDRQVVETFYLEAGATRTFDLELRGFLAAQVHVFEANGEPAPAGLQVAVTNVYTLLNKAPNGDLVAPFYQDTFSGNIAAGNTFSISAVRQGRLNVKVTDPLYPTRKGTGSVVTGYEGDVAHVNVSLVATGTVCGVVYLPDGTTPAAGARVAIKPNSEGHRLTDADEAGHFCFDILPRVNFRVDAQQASPGLGTYALTGSWATGEYEKTYSIVLDDTNPQVVSVSPVHNATGVPLSAKIVIEFSEAVCRTCGGISLYNAGGWGIGYTAAWSTDGKTATLTPSLSSNTGYRLVVRRPLADLAGREIAYEVTSVFQTADVVPPKVSEVLPANDVSQVAVGTTIKITFSEPIDPNLAPGNFQLLRLDQGNFSETLIPLVIAENRRVALTVTPDLAPDHHYELRVSGIRDTSGNVMAATFTSRFHTADTTPPDFAWTTPAEGQLFKAGDKIAFAGVPTDVRGVASVEYEIGGRRQLVTAAPYQAQIRAPFVAATGPVTVTAVAKDIFGNQATFTRTIVVEPQPSASAPTIGLSCPADGDWVERDVPLEVVLPLADDQAIESWELRIDGQPVKTVTGLAEPALTASYLWRPAAATAPGTSFTLELEARDFAGAATVRTWTVSVPTLAPIKSGNLPDGGARILGAGNIHFPATTRTLDALTLLSGAKLLGVDGSVLVVGGTFRAQCGSATSIDTLTSSSIVMESGSRLTGQSPLKPLRLTASSKLTVEIGGLIDASGKGYLGGSSIGGAPAGVTGSANAGGSHGGLGRSTHGTPGGVYGSLTQPRFGGGGGSPLAWQSNGAGGGAIEIDAGELELLGEVRARGADQLGNRESSGAGGSVLVRAATLAGSGLIDASGGDFRKQNLGCTYSENGGGGGRVSLLATGLSGFVPADQVRARGGRTFELGGTLCGDAGPGTVYLKTGSSTYGDLLIDAGAHTDGSDRDVPATPLPLLGGGAPSAFAAAGADAWISRPGGFAEHWLGAFAELQDGGGASLGVFEVVERDAAGRLRLAGAGSVTGAALYRGRYRFDAVKTLHGGGLASQDPIDAESIELAGVAKVSSPLEVSHLTVKAGARLSPAAGGSLILRVAGRMTVEAGAVVDATGKGYAGTAASSSAATGPAGVVVPAYAGGSHGGRPDRTNQGSQLGEVYDSVYRAQMRGGGSSNSDPVLGAGGGVIDIAAGELVLEGELRTRGYSRTATRNGTGNTGAGGSVQVAAGTLSGAGRIDAGGGSFTSLENLCVNKGSMGGGGRVSLLIGELDGFDPVAQAGATGGRAFTSAGAECVYEASPGTVYWKTSESTYGDLLLDAGTKLNGADRVVPPTQMPALGTGAVSAFEAAGPDAWMSRSGGFEEKWHGVWVELFSGSSLGVYEAISRDGAGRLRLAGAGALTGAATYQGRYRFDAVKVRHGAGLQATDTIETAATELTGEVAVTGVVTAETLTVKAGALVRPASGGTLTFRVSGTMTVETGAVIDVSGTGYAGGNFGGAPPAGPPGVLLADTAGGSHGGQPDRLRQGGGRIGEVYDSVYRPQMLGGGAAIGGPTAGVGGGIIDIEAGELVLDGELRSRGNPLVQDADPVTGAGGSVLVVAGTLSGAGRIDAGGGLFTATTSACRTSGSVGGGGRVGLLIGELDGFDPVSQVTAEGGRAKGSTGAECVYQASPGTIYVKTNDSTYGDLILDAGTLAGGGDRTVPATPLPALGTGTASAFEAAGADAWISRTGGGFAEKWHGVWVELLDAGGASLGIYEAVERDGGARLRLAGAGALSGVASFKGRYRFDAVKVLHGAGLQVTDVSEAEDLELAGQTRITGPVHAVDLVVKAGSVVVPAAGSSLSFRVTGTMTVEAGAVIDVTGKGYAGTSNYTSPATGPAGVAQPEYGGGSHGGRPNAPSQGSILGEVYDSVYRPQMSGGGASSSDPVAGAGGGVIVIEAGELVLEGELRARGYSRTATRNGTANMGAGGAVQVVAGTLSGGGSIDAGGGGFTSLENQCVNNGSMGGGGRVSLLVGELDGFDPAAQAGAKGGQSFTSAGADCAFQASPGTIYVKKPGSIYGDLILDAGTLANGSNRVVSPTQMPSLGTGAVGAFEAAGADAWISRTGGFAEKWHGVWVELFAGASLGVYEAVERDGAGRLRLAGAGALSGVANYKGRYRFDAVTVLHGAGLLTTDTVDTAATELTGDVAVTGVVSANTLVVKAGAVVRPASGGNLTFRVSGTMTVEAGAVIDVTGKGYAGTSNYTSPATGPAGVAQPEYGGGSHGGRPNAPSQGSILGDVYDSVYRPQMSGGGASSADPALGAGGGVIDIAAGELVLEGELRARGNSRTATRNGTANMGAGGAVQVVASRLSGGGLIDAGGGGFTSLEDQCVNKGSMGGGGRVSLLVGQLDGFDPAAQSGAKGGRSFTSAGADCSYQASPGTIYLKTGTSTYGDLLIDAGTLAGGIDRPVSATPLPALGSGAASAFEAAGDDAFLSRGGGFAEKWHGVWVELLSSGGVSLGIFEAVERDAGRLRLAGAGAATGVASYRGRYRFDAVTVKHGAGLTTTDLVDTASTELAGDVELTGALTAASLTVKSNAVLRPASGSSLTFRVTGAMTVEAGALVDVTGRGYPGTSNNTSTVTGPAGVAQPEYGGGSHGGRPNAPSQGSIVGEVFDSVYRPQMSGGGASYSDPVVGAGGGVIDIEAGELVLEGELRARGYSRTATRNGTANMGAGGAVQVVAGTLSGSGSIDAGGGSFTSLENQCVNNGSMGGGGRVSLLVGELDGFDPAVQAGAKGGRSFTSAGADCTFQASPGTIYVKTPSATYGSLILDAGTMVNGADRLVPATLLPALGTGNASAWAVAGGDAWISRGGGFAEKWLGAWVEVLDLHGDVLGIYPAAERDAAGRLRLAGAGSLTATVAGYRGVYRFDTLTRSHGAELSALDPLELGSALMLGRDATFNELRVPSLQIGAGATLRPAAGSPLRLVVPGTLTIAAGAKLDLSGAGYAGNVAGGQPGGAPAGVAGSVYAGGSHGGGGDTVTGTAGAVYDSVYRPRLGGGGGNRAAHATSSRGGGVVEVEAGSLVLHGQILARGDDYGDALISVGAGGSVTILAGQLSGAGTIDASGGTQTGCADYTGAGGGGRVALHVADLSLFDVATQARAYSGFTNCSGSIDRRAGAGTVYVKTTGSTYGSLRVDSGRPAGLTDRIRTTALPILGSTSVAALAGAGGDAWLTGGIAFPEAWLGAWVELFDASAQSLGLFEATSRDAAGRLRLAGAAGVSGAATCRGRYRFDQRVLAGGASLLAQELAGEAPRLEGPAFLDPDTTLAGDLTLAAGTVVKPTSGTRLKLKLTGTLTVEAGAKIDLAAVSATVIGAPDAPSHAGGSHGGGGDGGTTGAPALTYDSVYRPQLAGSAGSPAHSLNLGGGVVEIEAANVVLDGQILVQGGTFSDTNGYPAGAGGTVRLTAGNLSGSGLIDASGGTTVMPGACWANEGGGGGGRVALAVTAFAGFDPLSQARAWAGATDCTGTSSDRFAAAGTLFLDTPASAYGKLVIDAGAPFNGSTPRAARPTQLPLLGSGAPSSLTVAGGDLWLARSGGFGEHWLGVFVELRSAAGVVLGTYEAVERNGSAALRLAGAAAASAATQYRGTYRFDEVQMLRGGAFAAGDSLHSTAALLLERSGGLAEVHAPALEVKSPATITAVGGTMDLHIAGALTIEAGAALDATSGGYIGTTAAATAAGAPAGITGSLDAGGSHGGLGDTETGTASLIYDSVYSPRLGGGGGNRAKGTGLGRGGGVVKIAAASVLLGGQVRANGESHSGDGFSAGAGGTVSILTPSLSGGGLIEANGGTQTATGSTCVATSGGGGGGRVAIAADALAGFDPATQARAFAGRTDCPSAITDRYAAAGTVFVKTAASTYGTLHLDPGVSATGAPRVRGTTLPLLGVFTASSLTAAGGDAWLQRSGGFAEAWAGVWIELKDAGGSVLGLYEAVERDAAGRLRLAGAAASAATATGGRGYYRFDDIVTRNGAGFYLGERYGHGGYAAGLTTMDADFTGTDLELAPGATVKPATGHRFSIRLSGTLTVGAGAKLDVSTTSSAAPPAGITASTNAGGSHGGRGDTVSGTAGATFDSVYRPLLPGAPGNPTVLVTADGRGGGLIEIDAAKVVLDGELLARGGGFARAGAAGAGAGGTVRIDAPELVGSGLIDASGGNLASSDCHYQAGGGGGGRVALAVADLDSFAVDSQVRAWAGVTDCPGSADRFAAAGTIYVATAGATYGRLLVDAGEPYGGAPRAAVTTVLPPLGAGAPSGLTAAGGDAWLARSGGFPEHWLGVHVELRDAGGVLLGTFRAAERDGTARLRLAGAAAAVGQATAYKGVYLFDDIDVVRGAIADTGEAVPGAPTIFEGTVLVPSPLVAANVLVRSNAILRPQTGTTLALRVSGTLTVEAGAKIDVGGLASALPAGITPAPQYAGGSHGGSGDSNNGSPTGTLGPVYDSVYRPSLAGSAGATSPSSNRGGGVLDIEAGALVLEGELNAAGALSAPGGTAGAGGTVRLKTGTLSGAGSIDASGGNVSATSGACNWTSGAGGGGRIALDVSAFSSFDPLAQTRAWAGLTDCDGTSTSGDRFAAAGTVYYRTSSSTYGQLLLDAGDAWGGAPRQPRVTRLPVLGNGSLSTLTASGGDAWLVRSGGFAEHWWGVWVELRDAGGGLLGVYEAAERDGTGRLRLLGASTAAAGATTYKGIYRFDKVTLKRSAAFEFPDPVEAANVEVSGQIELGTPIAAGQMTVKSGAVVKPLKGATALALRVSGAMTVETGAKIDVTGLASTLAPAGFTGPASAGGSHGGSGDTDPGQSGVLGATFDSVYRPQLAGSAGANSPTSNRAGGVIDIEAGSLALEGELNAAGALSAAGGTAGAGGTVRVKTAILSGAGTIDASGGNVSAASGACNWNSGGGGGGRVGLDVGSFSSFDPGLQVKAWAGLTDCGGTATDRFAAAGTIYYRTSASTYGQLLLDAGDHFNSAPRPARVTRLPALGSGVPSSLTAAGGDAWLVGASSFAEQWWGVWVELRDSGGALLGVYEAVERNGSGHLRLAGASAAAGSATSYKGVYRFDGVTLRRSASYESPEPMETTSAELTGEVQIGSTFVAGQVTVKSGALVKPVKGGSSLTFRVSGALTVEAGAKIDVGGLVATGAPAGTTPTPVWAGGSHGGFGDTGSGGTAGGTFDSVYRPQLAGSSGSAASASNRAGGVIDIEAGSFALEGELNAAGALAAHGATAGSGGTVRVKTGTFSGAGSIDASGGNLAAAPGACNWNSGAGGGGRVGFEVSSFSGFDPDAQVKAWAGLTDCSGTATDRFAAAGTIYWKTSSSTYGILRVAAGDNWNGVERTPRATVLPTLGNGSFTSLTAAGADAWLVRSGNFPEHWLGVWVELKDASSAVIGVYPAVERNASGHLRLAGASGAAGTATTYRGLYRFDEVKLRQGSTLSGADTIEAGAYTSSWTPDGGEEMESLALAFEGDADAEGKRFDVEGRLFNDLDGDGFAGSSEPPIVGARVGAYTAAGERISEAITDRLGRYRLSEVPADSVVAVDADSLPGGVDIPSADPDGIATADRTTFGENDRRRLDFGYRQADLALPNAAPAPSCSDCAPAERATPSPSPSACLAEAPLDIVFLLDLGGLAEPFAGAASRLEAAQLALAAIERRLAERGDGSRFALLTYRGSGDTAEVHLLQGLSARADAFEDRLFGLAAQDLAPSGSPAAVALATASDLLAESLAAGRQPRIVWLGDRRPDVDARLRSVAGFDGDLVSAGGLFRRAAEVVPLGGYSRRLGTFGGQATADAMVAIEEAAARAPGLRIDGIALRGTAGRGDGRAPIEDLHDYAAAFTAGSRAAAADMRALEMAVEDLASSFVCAAR